MGASPFGNTHINLPQTTTSLSLFIFHLPLSVRTLLISLHTPELKASLLHINCLSLSLSFSHTHTHTHTHTLLTPKYLMSNYPGDLEVSGECILLSSVSSQQKFEATGRQILSVSQLLDRPCYSSQVSNTPCYSSQRDQWYRSYYSSILFRKWQENTFLRHEGMPTQRHEEKKGRTHQSVGVGERDPWSGKMPHASGQLTWRTQLLSRAPEPTGYNH